MTETGYYFDGVNHTETTDAEFHKMLMPKDGYLAGDGSSELAVIQNTPAAMNVIVGSGVAFVQGIRYVNSAAKTVTVDPADATYTRIDRIVLRITWASNTMQAVYSKGTAAASPTAPALTQTSAVYEHPLCTLTIPTGTTAITTAMISDERVRLYGTSITFNISGGGAVIAPGIVDLLDIPFPCTITDWELLPDETGSMVCDLKIGTYATHPTYTSITASAKPTVSAAAKATSSTLTGWITAIPAGSKLQCVVNSCTTITRATLVLHVTR